MFTEHLLCLQRNIPEIQACCKLQKLNSRTTLWVSLSLTLLNHSWYQSSSVQKYWGRYLVKYYSIKMTICLQTSNFDMNICWNKCSVVHYYCNFLALYFKTKMFPYLVHIAILLSMGACHNNTMQMPMQQNELFHPT